MGVGGCGWVGMGVSGGGLVRGSVCHAATTADCCPLNSSQVEPKSGLTMPPARRRATSSAH